MISYILNRENCIVRDQGFYIKDIRILNNRSLESVVIIDDNVFSFSSQMENGIYVPSFQGEEGDTTLLDLIPFLSNLIGLEDVRPKVSQFSGVYDLLKQYNNMIEENLTNDLLSCNEYSDNGEEDLEIPDEYEA